MSAINHHDNANESTSNSSNNSIISELLNQGGLKSSTGPESLPSARGSRQMVQNPYALKRPRLGKKGKEDENEDILLEWDTYESPMVKQEPKLDVRRAQDQQPGDIDVKVAGSDIAVRGSESNRLRLPSLALSIQSCQVLTFSETCVATEGSHVRVTAQVAAIRSGSRSLLPGDKHDDDHDHQNTIIELILTDPMNPAHLHPTVHTPLQQQKENKTVTATNTAKNNSTVSRRRSFTITPNPLLSKATRHKATSTLSAPTRLAQRQQNESSSSQALSPFLTIQFDWTKAACSQPRNLQQPRIQVGDLVTVFGGVIAAQTIEAHIVYLSNGTNVALQLKALQARRKYLSQFLSNNR